MQNVQGKFCHWIWDIAILLHHLSYRHWGPQSDRQPTSWLAGEPQRGICKANTIALQSKMGKFIITVRGWTSLAQKPTKKPPTNKEGYGELCNALNQPDWVAIQRSLYHVHETVYHFQAHRLQPQKFIMR